MSDCGNSQQKLVRAKQFNSQKQNHVNPANHSNQNMSNLATHNHKNKTCRNQATHSSQNMSSSQNISQTQTIPSQPTTHHTPAQFIRPRHNASNPANKSCKQTITNTTSMSFGNLTSFGLMTGNKLSSRQTRTTSNHSECLASKKQDLGLQP